VKRRLEALGEAVNIGESVEAEFDPFRRAWSAVSIRQGADRAPTS